VQVDPIKPMLKAPGTKRLKRKCDEPPSNFAFKFNLRRYNKGIEVICVIDPRMPPKARGDGDRLKQVVLNLLSK